MKICALILAYNNFDGLVRLVKNLKSQTLPPDRILVVDNNSSDETRKIKALFPEIRYVKLSENLGSAGGYHYGLKIASRLAEYVFISDDDVVYEASALENLYGGFMALSGKENIGAVRCVWENYSSPYPLKVESSGWTGILICSETVKDIGFPIKEFFMYAEDIEYFTRLTRRGYSFYAIPGSRYLDRPSGHKVRADFLGLSVTVYRSEFRLYYAFRNEVYAYMLYGKYLAALRTALYFLKCSIVLRNPKKTKAMLEGVLDGFAGKLGKKEKYFADRKI